MKTKKPWYSYLWIWSIVYFALGFFKAAPHNLARAFGQRFCLIRKL